MPIYGQQIFVQCLVVDSLPVRAFSSMVNLIELCSETLKFEEARIGYY